MWINFQPIVNILFRYLLRYCVGGIFAGVGLKLKYINKVIIINLCLSVFPSFFSICSLSSPPSTDSQTSPHRSSTRPAQNTPSLLPDISIIHIRDLKLATLRRLQRLYNLEQTVVIYTTRSQHNQTSAHQASPQCTEPARCFHPPQPHQSAPHPEPLLRKYGHRI